MASSQLPIFARVTRWIVTIHFVALATQIGVAIAFVSGMGGLFPVHSSLSLGVTVLGVFQAVVLFILRSPRISKMYLVFASLVAAGEIAQLRIGPLGIPVGETALHVTLAMIIWGCSLAIFIRLLDP